MQDQFLAGSNQNQQHWVITRMYGQPACTVKYLWAKSGTLQPGRTVLAIEEVALVFREDIMSKRNCL